MSAQTLKMKGKLEKIKKGREVFEEKKRNLDLEMARSRINMMNISKGIQKKDVAELTVKVPEPTSMSEGRSLQTPRTTGMPTPRGNTCSTPRSNRSVMNALSGGSNLETKLVGTVRGSIVPSGPRVSDWCFIGAIESDPPVVKVNTVYEVVRMLGRGSFGDVNLVRTAEDNKLFAMKTIFTEKEIDMDDTLREVRFLRTNRHPCIIDVHDGFMTPQPRMLHIVMPYCESGDLMAVIKTAKKNKTNISEDKILRWIVQLGLALHFLHENNVVHRDLKPNNVMLTEGAELIKLVDFGLAFTVVKVDCWSFGVLLFELLNLSMPFNGNTTAELVGAILNDPPPPITAFYSPGLMYIANQLLNKDQDKRMGMGGMLLHPFLLSRTTSFPSHYKPRNIEERIKRGHCKQLQAQLDSLTGSKNSSLIGHSHQDKPAPTAAEALSCMTDTLNSPKDDDDDFVTHTLNSQVTNLLNFKIAIPGHMSCIPSADGSLGNTLDRSVLNMFSPVMEGPTSDCNSMTDTLNSPREGGRTGSGLTPEFFGDGLDDEGSDNNAEAEEGGSDANGEEEGDGSEGEMDVDGDRGEGSEGDHEDRDSDREGEGEGKVDSARATDEDEGKDTAESLSKKHAIRRLSDDVESLSRKHFKIEEARVTDSALSVQLDAERK